MSDSVAVLDVVDPTDSDAVQSTVQTWLDSNTVTSVDYVDYERVGRQRAQVMILYTA